MHIDLLLEECSYHSSGRNPKRTLPGSAARTGRGKLTSSLTPESEAEPRATSAVAADCLAAAESDNKYVLITAVQVTCLTPKYSNAKIHDKS